MFFNWVFYVQIGRGARGEGRGGEGEKGRRGDKGRGIF